MKRLRKPLVMSAAMLALFGTLAACDFSSPPTGPTLAASNRRRHHRPPTTTTTQAPPSTTTTTGRATTTTAKATTTTTQPSGGGAPSVRVVGNNLVDASGHTVRLLGVNRSGTEYACIQGWSIFDGPSDDTSLQAMTSWHIKVVRIPMNEDCWLGINGVDSQYGGANYRTAIQQYVARLHAHGMAAILDLHTAAGGTNQSTDMVPMADADHAPAFWKSVASTFKSDPDVVFDLYNEPHDISWSCWLDGGCDIGGYKAAGMQQLLDAVRSTGATQVALAGGVGYAGDLSEWLAHKPSDSAGQLAASLHTYNFGPCDTTCRSQVEGVARQVPVVAGEIGENDCAHGYIDDLMSWLDAHGMSYLGWTWTEGPGWTCEAGPTLITSYDGTPTGFGVGLRDHLRAVG